MSKFDCRCKNCMWFVQGANDSKPKDAYCLCMPPTADKDDNPHYPRVSKDMTCGQWVDRKTGNTPKHNFYVKFLHAKGVL